MSVFKTAAKKTAAAPKATGKKKNTTWITNDNPDTESAAVAKSLHELVALHAQVKTLDAKMEVHKSTIKRYARKNFFRDYASMGVFPETPMIVQNAEGEKATFVVQDRSTQYAVKDDQRDALVDALGEDKANELIVDDTTFSFNRDLLQNETVMAELEAALEGVQNKLREAGVITDGDELITATTKSAFRAGMIQQLAIICGRDVVKMEQVAEAMGSSTVMYVKP